MFDELINQNENILFFDTGDIVNPLMLGSKDTLVAKLYEELNYNALAIGDQELIGGVDVFNSMFNKFDFVSSNLRVRDADINEYKIFTLKNGIKIGVTGINYNSNFTYLKRSKVIKDGDIEIDKANKSLRKTLMKLQDNCDYVVVLSHLNEYGNAKILDNVEGYNLLIGGHGSHEYKYARQINRKLHVQNGIDGEKAGIVKLTFKDNKLYSWEYELKGVDTRKYKRDEKFEEIIKKMGEDE